jgi:hypothetical protein
MYWGDQFQYWKVLEGTGKLACSQLGLHTDYDSDKSHLKLVVCGLNLLAETYSAEVVAEAGVDDASSRYVTTLRPILRTPAAFIGTRGVCQGQSKKGQFSHQICLMAGRARFQPSCVRQATWAEGHWKVVGGESYIFHYVERKSGYINQYISIYSSLTRFLAEGPDFSCFSADSNYLGRSL